MASDSGVQDVIGNEWRQQSSTEQEPVGQHGVRVPKQAAAELSWIEKLQSALIHQTARRKENASTEVCLASPINS